MRVVLAGYNVDSRVLREAEEAGVPRERLTPEVISAAYARICRDPRPVSELRRIALDEVEAARASNKRIIFEMGHHSVAEHAVFNFDITGISRLAIEALERFRLCSFTEKSQRYVTLDHDFVLPPEIRGTPLEPEFLSLVAAQSALYEKLYEALRTRISRLYPAMEERSSTKRTLDGWAKEDARYATILATSGQLGLTANARNVELLVRRFAAAPLAEVRDLGKLVFETTSAVAPSLLLFTKPAQLDTETPRALEALARGLLPAAKGAMDATPVRLLDHTADADRLVAASLLHAGSRSGFGTCRAVVAAMSREELGEVLRTAMRHMEFYDAPPREFEHVALTYELTVSAACFAQLKRHRMATLSAQDYDPALGITVPPSVAECGLEDDLRNHVARAEDLCEKIREKHPAAAAYALTNAHRRKVLFTTNLRDLYHFTRLREDAHAQWDIREIARAMREEAEKAMPLGSLLLCGKDGYVERFAGVFGEKPLADPSALG
ncbi:MAG: FAD-dependent thymidylate synthase [Deltaproteobacteria bacterium]|nr:FAD-dependent thymidylate synthase [Deltaproteobacteria bacterium]